jgi:zinc protease
MRLGQFLTAITLMGVYFVTSSMAAAADAPREVTSVEGITEYRLNNGLKLLLFPDPSKPKVTVALTIFVGSRHEGYGEAGMAHLLEHMLFKGTPDHPSVPKVLKEHGAQFNGTTWLDRTNYYETLPASDENLEFALRLEADRMMNSFVKAEDLASEMTVVRNEFERGENSPSSILAQRMTSAAFEWHNYGKSTIGNRADIERVPIENLRDFYRRYYQPDNAMVVIAGSFEPDRALGYVQKYFGAIPQPERQLPNTYTEEPAQDGERMVTLRRVGDVALAGALYHIPSGAHPDYASLDVLERLLTAPSSGRLYKALVETKLASSVSGAAYALHDPGLFRLMADVTPGNDPRDILNTLLEVTETVAEQGVSEEEVERAKTYWLKEWELGFAESDRIAIQLSEWAAQGDWRLIFLYRDRLEQVTPESVQAVAGKYLQQNNRTVGLFVPTEAPQRISVPPTPELASMIGDYQGRRGLVAGEAFDVSPQHIESRTSRLDLGTGLKVALLPKKTRGEAVHLRLTLRYGDVRSLHGLASACEALPVLMARGTKSLTRQQIQDRLDQLRTRLSPGGTPGEATFTLETRREFFPQALDILRQVLREATLPQEEFDLIQNKRITDIEQQLTDPQALALTHVRRQVSPHEPGDPRYVPTLPESTAQWKAVTCEDVRTLYSDYLSGAHGELAVIGDFDADEVRPLLETMLGDWSARQPYTRIPRPGDIALTSSREQILTPDKPNATYIAGSVFPLSDGDDDYPPVLIGNFILGSSGLSSRLGDRVRQKEGLSYGVGSVITAQSLDQRTALLIYAITNPDNMSKVETAIREEIELLLRDGITEAELSAARQGYLEQQKVARAEDSSLAATLTSGMQADRTMLYHAELEQRISNLTVDEVNSALRRYVDPARIVLAVAGDFKQVPQPDGSR